MARRSPHRFTPSVKLQKTAQHTDITSSFGCLLIEQFPVWAAHFQNPLLAAQPLLITHRGEVLSASRDALACGVRVGWTLARAQSICPQAQVRAYNAAECTLVWEELLASLYGLTPCIEPIKPGVAFFEPPAHLNELAVLSRLINTWDGKAAIAPDRPTVELFTHRTALGRLQRLSNEAHYRFLSQTPAALLAQVGISSYTIERLKWFGFKSIADLQRLTRQQVACQFFQAEAKDDARLLWKYSRAGTEAADRQPVQSYRLQPFRSARIVFEQAATCPTEWEQALCDITQQVTAQLNGLGAGALRVHAETSTGPLAVGKLLREKVSSSRTLFHAARELLLSLLNGQNSGSDITIEALEIRLLQLGGHGTQNTLFSSRECEKAKTCNSPSNSPATSKRRTNRAAVNEKPVPNELASAVKSIESRFPQSMWRIALRDAYATLPDERYSLKPAAVLSTD
jgi:nucleotidyltransferase/DNA polymerase involved in DNA repair